MKRTRRQRIGPYITLDAKAPRQLGPLRRPRGPGRRSRSTTFILAWLYGNGGPPRLIQETTPNLFDTALTTTMSTNNLGMTIESKRGS